MSRLPAICFAVCLVFTGLLTPRAGAMGRFRHAHSRHLRIRAARTHVRHARASRSRAARLHPAEFDLQHTSDSQHKSAQPKYDLVHFQESPGTCRSTGRLQDKQYCSSQTMDEIVADEKAAVPTLIARLTDETRVESPIFDHWSYMTVGDVAYFILDDLFTEANAYVVPRSKSSLGGCDAGPEPCWHRFFSQQSRAAIHDEWLAAWNARKDQIYWDQKAACFRVIAGSNDGARMVKVDLPLPSHRGSRRHHR